MLQSWMLRANIKFCFKLQKIAKEAHEMLSSVYGDNVVTLKTVYKWYDRFKIWSESIEDELRSGRPVTSKTDENMLKVAKMSRLNWRLTIWELSKEPNISFGSVQSEENDQKTGMMASCCIVITHHVTPCFWFVSVCPNLPYSPVMALGETLLIMR